MARILDQEKWEELEQIWLKTHSSPKPFDGEKDTDGGNKGLHLKDPIFYE